MYKPETLYEGNLCSYLNIMDLNCSVIIRFEIFFVANGFPGAKTFRDLRETGSRAVS